MAKRKEKPAPQPNENLLVLTPEQEKALCTIIAEYQGPATTLESAIGALVVGQHYGTRVLRMIHNASTYRKYEKILGIEFKKICEPETNKSRKIVGIKIADKLGGYWDIVMGRKKVENKGYVESDTGNITDA